MYYFALAFLIKKQLKMIQEVDKTDGSSNCNRKSDVSAVEKVFLIDEVQRVGYFFNI